jgi:hypothetical protein
MILFHIAFPVLQELEKRAHKFFVAQAILNLNYAKFALTAHDYQNM